MNIYSDAIQTIKYAILKSRYRAATLANRELLSLYFGIGKYISENSRTCFWGTGAIDTISERLQQELPGLRGFSAGNIKKMRLFYEEWSKYIKNSSLITNNFDLIDKESVVNRSFAKNNLRQISNVDFRDDKDKKLNNSVSLTHDLKFTDNQDDENYPLQNDYLEISEIQNDESWHLATDELQSVQSDEDTNRSSVMNDLCKLPTESFQCPKDERDINRSLVMNEFEGYVSTIKSDFPLKQFLQVGFTHHCEIIYNVKLPEERLFYIERCATGFWSVETLKYHIKSNLFSKRGKFPNNFKTTISDQDLQRKALLSFKDEYLLDHINIESPEDEPDERVLESAIVNNIRKFIMSLGKDFSFIGNQYRLIVDEVEYFVDLLFFNRQLQCLVAFDLKRGNFKPEYLGKMNFYLSACDDLIRLPHENPSIGIILCKSQKQKTVEYAFRDMTKPMGVATYKTASELPPKYRNVLPDAEKLKELL